MVAREGDGRVAGDVPEDKHFPAKFPAIWEFLTEVKLEDGTTRVPSTLMLIIEDGSWKACLNDRENERSCWMAGLTLDTVLARLEATLCDGEAEWRKWRGAGRKKK